MLVRTLNLNCRPFYFFLQISPQICQRMTSLSNHQGLLFMLLRLNLPWYASKPENVTYTEYQKGKIARNCISDLTHHSLYFVHSFYNSLYNLWHNLTRAYSNIFTSSNLMLHNGNFNMIRVPGNFNMIRYDFFFFFFLEIITPYNSDSFY